MVKIGISYIIILTLFIIFTDDNDEYFSDKLEVDWSDINGL